MQLTHLSLSLQFASTEALCASLIAVAEDKCPALPNEHTSILPVSFPSLLCATIFIMGPE